MNVAQIRNEVGPSAAQLAERVLARKNRQEWQDRYNYELGVQMQQMKPMLDYLKMKYVRGQIGSKTEVL